MSALTLLEQDALSHYSSNGLKLMSLIEDAEGRGLMFHESYPDLEQRFWSANDARDLSALKGVYRELCRLHDKLTMD